MRKDLLAFLNGEKNAVQFGDAVFSREVTPNGIHHLILSLDGVVLMEEWRNPKKKSGNDPPKHTGGKKPYIMLLTQEVDELRKKGVPNREELVGFLVCLGSHIEWSTGRLIHKRSKKPLRYKDLQSLFSGGRKKLDRILASLKEHDLLYGTQDGYVVSTRLIKKGRAARNGL